MIDFRFILLLVFALFYLIIVNREEDPINNALMYISGFGFFFVGLDIIINGISDVSSFLSVSSGIVFWALGIITLLRTPLMQIEEDW